MEIRPVLDFNQTLLKVWNMSKKWQKYIPMFNDLYTDFLPLL